MSSKKNKKQKTCLETYIARMELAERKITAAIESIPMLDEDAVFWEMFSEAVQHDEARPHLDVGRGGLFIQLWDVNKERFAYKIPLIDLLKDFIDITDFAEPNMYNLTNLADDIRKLLKVVEQAEIAATCKEGL